jgi:hypothetical protein
MQVDQLMYAEELPVKPDDQAAVYCSSFPSRICLTFNARDFLLNGFSINPIPSFRSL